MASRTRVVVKWRGPFDKLIGLQKVRHSLLVMSKSKSHYDWRSVSQSVMSWCRAQSRTFDQRSSPHPPKLLSCLFGAPSLTRGRVCHVSVFVIAVYNSQSLFTLIIYNIYINLNNYFLCYIHLQCNAIFTIYTGLVLSRLCTADYALLTSYHDSFRHLNSLRVIEPELQYLFKSSIT
jgi:hypothetical protein